MYPRAGHIRIHLRDAVCGQPQPHQPSLSRGSQTSLVFANVTLNIVLICAFDWWRCRNGPFRLRRPNQRIRIRNPSREIYDSQIGDCAAVNRRRGDEIGGLRKSHRGKFSQGVQPLPDPSGPPSTTNPPIDLLLIQGRRSIKRMMKEEYQINESMGPARMTLPLS